jgi:hypothetical protein
LDIAVNFAVALLNILDQIVYKEKRFILPKIPVAEKIQRT